jgi:hypothetical protein
MNKEKKILTQDSVAELANGLFCPWGTAVQFIRKFMKRDP